MPPRILNGKIYQHIFWSQVGFGAILIAVIWTLLIITLILDVFGYQLVRDVYGAESVLPPAWRSALPPL